MTYSQKTMTKSKQVMVIDTRMFITALSTFFLSTLIPTVSYVYSQGESHESQKQLTHAMVKLNQSVSELSKEAVMLTSELQAEKVQIHNNTKHIDALEDEVRSQGKVLANVAARIQEKGD